MDREKRSKQIYAVKSAAIISVICAHMKLQLEYGAPGWLSDKLISIFSILGVPVFFICAGFYYYRKKGDSAAFWKKKLITIIIPWLVWAFITNITRNIISNRRISIAGFMEWFSGYSSLYYFLAVLMFCFVIFKPYKCHVYLISLSVLSLIANVLTVLEVSGGGISDVKSCQPTGQIL